jgi:hypothetical protein
MSIAVAECIWKTRNPVSAAGVVICAGRNNGHRADDSNRPTHTAPSTETQKRQKKP